MEQPKEITVSLSPLVAAQLMTLMEGFAEMRERAWKAQIEQRKAPRSPRALPPVEPAPAMTLEEIAKGALAEGVASMLLRMTTMSIAEAQGAVHPRHPQHMVAMPLGDGEPFV
jgi:hypothetical protein